MKRIFLLITISLFTACATTPESPDTSYNDIQPTLVSCFDFPFEKDPAPIQPEIQKKLEKLETKLECQWFTYKVDGYSVRGFYMYAKEKQAEALPVVIFNRGGNAMTGVTRFKTLSSRFIPLVKQGYLVIGTQYRGAREGNTAHPDMMADQFGGTEVNDILALFPIIDTMPMADATRIGMVGSSRGAMMSYLTATRTDRIRALITIGGPTDLFKELPYRPNMETQVLAKWIPDYQNNKTRELTKRSAQMWPEKLPPSMPILLMHGEDDDRVQPENSVNMAKKLKQHGIPHKLALFPDAGHGIKNRDNKSEFNRTIIEWLNLHVKNHQPTQQH